MQQKKRRRKTLFAQFLLPAQVRKRKFAILK
jgi:hypothetical protein